MANAKQSTTETLLIGVAGNPNTGKTTLFNALTGMRLKTGNWPGVTVERIEGRLTHKDKTLTLVDLPGIYGLTADSEDERIARDFLLHEQPSAVLVVADSTNLERNLYLVLMLLEMEQKVVLALNMWDEAQKAGIRIDTETLSGLLGVEVVPTVATRKEGVEKLKDALIRTIEKPPPKTPDVYPKEVTQFLDGFCETLPEGAGAGARFMASLYLGGDIEAPVEKTTLTRYQEEFKKRFGKEAAVYFAEHRFSWCHGVASEVVKSVLPPSARFALTDKLDSIFINRLLGIPILAGVLYFVFWFIFTLGDPLVSYVDDFFSWLGGVVSEAVGSPQWLASLLGDGIIGGVGAVLVFVPLLILLYLIFSALEDCGYLARGAFLIDRIMHFFKLHGRSFIPMFLGFGCSIPGILATRTLTNRRDRLLTILAVPFASCSARLPVYALFIAAFFPNHKATVLFALYAIGIVMGLLSALLIGRLLFPREEAPLVMELPPYRLPSPRVVFATAWQRTLIFVKKAGTIILGVTVLIWALASLPPGVEYASEKSLAGRLGKAVAPVFEPAGFGSWQASVALLTGILAKEAVVSTMGVLYTGEEVEEEEAEEELTPHLHRHFTPLSAFAFLLMTLLYIPCVAAVGAIRREAGWRWAIFTAVYTLFVGWLVATLFYQIASLFA